MPFLLWCFLTIIPCNGINKQSGHRITTNFPCSLQRENQTVDLTEVQGLEAMDSFLQPILPKAPLDQKQSHPIQAPGQSGKQKILTICIKRKEYGNFSHCKKQTKRDHKICERWHTYLVTASSVRASPVL